MLAYGVGVSLQSVQNFIRSQIPDLMVSLTHHHTMKAADLDFIIDTTDETLVSIPTPFDRCDRTIASIIKLDNGLFSNHAQVPHSCDPIISSSQDQFLSTRDGHRQRIQRTVMSRVSSYSFSRF
jgi:hypothetical protein